MDKFIMTIAVILLVYLCVYAIVNRICKRIEHHTEYMYRSLADVQWRQDHRLTNPGINHKGKEDGNFYV